MKHSSLYISFICVLFTSLSCGQAEKDLVLSPGISDTSREGLQKRQYGFLVSRINYPENYLKDFPTTVLRHEIKDRQKELGVGSESFRVLNLVGGYDPQKLLANYPELKS